jgi:hypothetical protein
MLQISVRDSVEKVERGGIEKLLCTKGVTKGLGLNHFLKIFVSINR